MKKIITLAMLLAMAVGMQADLVLKTEGRISVCPGIFTNSGNPIVYLYNNDKATIYTSDFLVDKTFSLVKSEYLSGQFTEQATVIPTGLIAMPEDSYGGKNYSIYNWIAANSQEEMINKMKENNPSATLFLFTDPMGNFACYYYESQNFKYENLFGKRYPTSWYALNDGYICIINTYDSFYTVAYNEENLEWIRTSENITTSYRSPSRFDIEVEGLYGHDELRFFQNLFNVDDKWEYIVPEYGPLVYDYYYSNVAVDDDGIVTVTRSGGVSSSCIGGAVYNEDGTKLGVLPSGYSNELYIINGRKFLESHDYETGEYCLYEIRSDNGDFDLVEMVREEGKRMLGAVRGIVTVDINAEQAGGEVVVSTTDGKVIANKRVGIGQTQVNDQPLPAGIYVVSLIKDGCVVESEKYLVQ